MSPSADHSASSAIDREPSAITLRYLQTLTEIGVEKNTTVVFPLPLDLLRMIAGAPPMPAAKP